MYMSSRLSNAQDKYIVAAMLPSGYLYQHLLYKGYPINYPLQWFCGKNPLMGVLKTFSQWYLCNHRYNVCRVEFENVMKSTTKKK